MVKLKNRSVGAAFTAGLVMGTAATMGVLTEALVRVLCPLVGMPGIDPSAAGVIATFVAIFATLTAVFRAAAKDM